MYEAVKQRERIREVAHGLTLPRLRAARRDRLARASYEAAYGPDWFQRVERMERGVEKLLAAIYRDGATA